MRLCLWRAWNWSLTMKHSKYGFISSSEYRNIYNVISLLRIGIFNDLLITSSFAAGTSKKASRPTLLTERKNKLFQLPFYQSSQIFLHICPKLEDLKILTSGSDQGESRHLPQTQFPPFHIPAGSRISSCQRFYGWNLCKLWLFLYEHMIAFSRKSLVPCKHHIELEDRGGVFCMFYR